MWVEIGVVCTDDFSTFGLFLKGDMGFLFGAEGGLFGGGGVRKSGRFEGVEREIYGSGLQPSDSFFLCTELGRTSGRAFDAWETGFGAGIPGTRCARNDRRRAAGMTERKARARTRALARR